MDNGLCGIYKETFPALLVSGVISLVPGFFLSIYTTELSFLHGLLTLIPALIGMRGNIFGSFCSYLSSRKHLDHHLSNPQLHSNSSNVRQEILDNEAIDTKARISATMAEVLFLSIILPIAGSIVFHILKEEIAPLETILFVCIASGVTTGLLLSKLSILIVNSVRNRGLDPDNIGPPVITTLGDVITLPIIAAFVKIVQSMSRNMIFGGNCIGFLLMGYYFSSTFKTSQKVFFSTLKQRVPVLVCCMILSSVSGYALEKYLTHFFQAYLLFVPLVNAQGGNAGSIFASRISSSIIIASTLLKLSSHQNGNELPSSKNSSHALNCNSRVTDSSSITLSVMSVFILIITGCCLLIDDFPLIPLLSVFGSLSLIIGFSSAGLAIVLSIGAVYFGINPENAVIPIVCALMDVIGTCSFALLLFFALAEHALL